VNIAFIPVLASTQLAATTEFTLTDLPGLYEMEKMSGFSSFKFWKDSSNPIFGGETSHARNTSSREFLIIIATGGLIKLNSRSITLEQQNKRSQLLEPLGCFYS
jgi:hypothetical protein